MTPLGLLYILRPFSAPWDMPIHYDYKAQSKGPRGCLPLQDKTIYIFSSLMPNPFLWIQSRGIVSTIKTFHFIIIRQVPSDPKLSTRRLARLIEQIGKAAYNLGYTPGLNPAQWAALRYFDEAALDRRTVTGFAQFQGTTKGTASQTVAALVRKKILQRVCDNQDRRIYRLIITCKGKTFLKNDPLEDLRHALETLNQEERGALAVSVEKVLRQRMKR